MSFEIIYTVKPAFGQSYGLLIKFWGNDNKESDLWVHFGGMGSDFLEPPPWWTDVSNIEQPIPEKFDLEKSLEIVNLLENVLVCPVPDFAMGCDGTQYKIEMGSGFNKAVYHWWSELPFAWSSLKPVVEILENTIEARRSNA